MKKTLLTVAAAAVGIAFAQAQTVDITITGATAFRGDAYNAIRSLYAAGYSQNPAHPASSQQRVTWSGTMPTVFGGRTVIVRTSYSGSAAGVCAVANSTPVSFLANASPAGDTATVNLVADFAFSDVFQSSTDCTSPVLEEGFVPGESKPGIAVIPFIFTRGNTCNARITNMTSQIARAMTGVGFLPLHMFTGVPADFSSPEIVNLVGRDNGSGTRITTLSEIGLGPLPSIAQRRASGGNWIDDPVGFSSGGTVATNLNGTSTSADGPGGAISYLAPNDSNTAVAGGGAQLRYDGVEYSPDAVRYGEYTLWGFEHLYSLPLTPGTDEDTFRTSLISTIDAGISGANAIKIGTMRVTRLADGATVTP